MPYVDICLALSAADVFLFFIFFLFFNLELNIFLRYATAAYAIGPQVSASIQFHDVLTDCLSTMFPRSEHTRECYQDEWYCAFGLHLGEQRMSSSDRQYKKSQIC